MSKKTDETKYTLLPKKRVMIEGMHSSRRVYQMQALRDIPRHGIKAGDLGGYVERKSLLSQDGDCWIKEGSVVLRDPYAYTYIRDNALIDGQYVIQGSIIQDNAMVFGGNGIIINSNLGNSTKIEGNIHFNGAKISGFSSIKYIAPNSDIGGDFDGLKSKISLISASFKDINLSGNGKIYKVSSDKSFEVSGSFCLTNFVDSHYKAVTLTKPFKANGDIKVVWVEFNDTLVELSGKVALENVYFSEGPVHINGGTLKNCQARGLVDIEGNVSVEDSFLQGENYLRDTVQITGAQLKGRNILSGVAKVDHGSQIENQVVSQGLVVPENNGKTCPSLSQNGITANISVGVSPVAEISPVVDLGAAYKEIIKIVEADYEAYTTDIVKLIKYPAMGDASIPETQDLMLKLRSAQRFLKVNDVSILEKVSTELEQAFIKAENKAYKLAATFLDEKERAGLKRADKALAIALDENANEHERRAGYKSGMKSLEGVLPISEQAIFALKERIGLKEIEA